MDTKKNETFTNRALDLDCVEASVINGVKFPVQLGPFTFNKEDAQKII